MSRKRPQTPPTNRNRRNSLEGTPRSESRKIRGRRRSNSISSPNEFQRLKRSKVNKSKNVSRRFTGKNRISRIYVEEKKARILKRKEKKKKINLYAAEYRDRWKGNDRIAAVKRRMRNYIIGEIVRQKEKTRELAAQRIKDWYFKMRPMRLEFLRYYEEINKEREIMEGDGDHDRSGSGFLEGTYNDDPMMTPEHRVIRMKEELRKKYSPMPSPSSNSKNLPGKTHENYDGEYIGDELDALDEDFIIPASSTQKERESVESSLLTVGDFEKSDIVPSLNDFLQKYDENEDEMSDDEFEDENRSYSINLPSFRENRKANIPLELLNVKEEEVVGGYGENTEDVKKNNISFERTSLVQRRRKRRRKKEYSDNIEPELEEVEEEEEREEMLPQQASYADMFLLSEGNVSEENEEEPKKVITPLLKKKRQESPKEEQSKLEEVKVEEVIKGKELTYELPVISAQVAMIPEPQINIGSATTGATNTRQKVMDTLGVSGMMATPVVSSLTKKKDVEEERRILEVRNGMRELALRNKIIKKNSSLNQSGIRKRKKVTRTTTTVTTQQTRECCVIL